ncbi:MAG: GSCFA family protein [Cytophagales bacterium]|nr:MAG: GSCFA family protein [Cytophagales bacterium]TAF60096.1 MAG: GSCFA family protein [Cytophagales bacterium]
MHPFRTIVQPQKPAFRLNFRRPIVLMGSCFASEIGQKLQNGKFEVLTNPFGTIFNPLVLSNLLQFSNEADFSPFYIYNASQGLWHNFMAHSSLSAHSQDALASLLGNRLETLQAALQQSSCVILTLGTAFVYKHLVLNTTIANCHREPASVFEKKMLSVEEVKNSLAQVLNSSILKNKSIILTVSPVRHIKDSLELNSVSKAVLRLAVHELVQEHASAYYFPAFELLNDDLRDYRFYAEDMLHPSKVATDYIFEKFSEICLDEESQSFWRNCLKIQAMLAHKLQETKGQAAVKFLKKLLLDMEASYFEGRFQEEARAVRSQLHTIGGEAC